MIARLLKRLVAALREARRDYRDMKRELGTYSNDEIDRLLP